MLHLLLVTPATVERANSNIDIDFDKVVDEFAKKKSRRKPLLNTVEDEVVVVVNHCFTSLFDTNSLLSDIITR